MGIHETTRQCGGAGSSSSSRCGVFPGTEASRRNRPSVRRRPFQREALEEGVAVGRRGRLGRKPHPPRATKLSEKQKRQLVDLLVAGPLAAGFRTDLWTCARVTALVRKQFRVSYHPDHLGRIMHDLGFSPQKPRPVAREQDPAAVGTEKGSGLVDEPALCCLFLSVRKQV